jgi:hypothetical protein
VQVGPEDPTAHLVGDTQQVMVIVPVNAEINEAQYVGQEYGKHGAQCRELDPMGDLQLQHHDGHNDREHRIAEYFHSRLAHHSAPATVLPLFNRYHCRRALFL